MRPVMNYTIPKIKRELKHCVCAPSHFRDYTIPKIKRELKLLHKRLLLCLYYTIPKIKRELKQQVDISNLRKGDNVPSVEVLTKVCKYLDVSADYLLGLSDY